MREMPSSQLELVGRESNTGILKGFCNPAQGWREAPTLGTMSTKSALIPNGDL